MTSATPVISNRDPGDESVREHQLLAAIEAREAEIAVLRANLDGSDMDEPITELDAADAFRQMASDMAAGTVQGHPGFFLALMELARLHAKKGADYGTGQDLLANVRASEAFGVPAWVGTLIRANDKIKRLQSFAIKGVLANEAAEDSLIDLAAYAVIALILLREATPQDGSVEPR